MPAGHEEGLFTSKKMAASRARPMASSSSGRIDPHTSNDASSSTFSGIGTMAAISSALRYLFDHAASVVCLSPVSPLRK